MLQASFLCGRVQEPHGPPHPVGIKVCFRVAEAGTKLVPHDKSCWFGKLHGAQGRSKKLVIAMANLDGRHGKLSLKAGEAAG